MMQTGESDCGPEGRGRHLSESTLGYVEQSRAQGLPRGTGRMASGGVCVPAAGGRLPQAGLDAAAFTR
jgi:hypothetical protein